MVSVAVGPILTTKNLDFFRFTTENPGIGGTEFQMILIAQELGRAGFQVDLVSLGGNVSSNDFQCVSLERALEKTYNVQITSIGASSLTQNYVFSANARLIMSHHPHDMTRAHRDIVSRFHVLISVGEYQYWSNYKAPVTHIWMPGFSRIALNPVSRKKSEDFVVGHISSLHPSKGFLVLAKAWKRVSDSIPNARLEVIGGIEQYNLTSNDYQIPAEVQYANKIRRAFGGEVPSNVSFLGVLPGPELDSRVSGWDVSVLNPTGTGEADPGVIKDCWRQGVPVISTLKYGMGDYIRYFPELRATFPSSVSRKLITYYRNPELRARVIGRCSKQSLLLETRTELTRIRWREVVEAASRSTIEQGTSPWNRLKPDRLSVSRRLMMWFGSIETCAILKIGELRSSRRQPSSD
jgi:hypothetical protein